MEVLLKLYLLSSTFGACPKEEMRTQAHTQAALIQISSLNLSTCKLALRTQWWVDFRGWCAQSVLHVHLHYHCWICNQAWNITEVQWRLSEIGSNKRENTLKDNSQRRICCTVIAIAHFPHSQSDISFRYRTIPINASWPSVFSIQGKPIGT